MSNAPRDPSARRDWGGDDSGTPILHVDMDSFFAQVEMREDPSLVGAPLIVGGTGPRAVVTSATYEARALGVRAGMPMARARALCPQARIASSPHSLYRSYSRRVMAILDEVTDRVEQVSIDEAFLDVAGARRRLGSPVEIARLVRRRIREEVGLPASVGVASTKSVAKIASSHAKPDGLLLVPAEATVAFLHSLPVGALWGVGGRTAEVLDREGVVTVADLVALDRSRLVRLLGPAQAHHLRELAMGVDPRPVRARAEEKSVGMERTFEVDVTDRAELERFVLRASHECGRRLRAMEAVGWTVVLKVRDASFHTITRSVTLPGPTDLGARIAREALGLFAAVGVPAGGARLMGVRVEGLARRADGVAVALDDDGRPEATERAMDAVVERFGAASLRPASLVTPPADVRGRGAASRGSSRGT